MPRPLFSVVIPARDQIHLLPLAIQSVLNQSWTELELWVVGVKTEAQIHAILKQLGHQDARLFFLDSEDSMGVVKKLKGRYVAYLNEVDLWFPTHLQTLAQELRDHDFVQALVAESNFEDQLGVSTLYLPSADLSLKTGYQGRRLMLSGIAHVRTLFSTLPVAASLLLQEETLDLELWSHLFEKSKVKVKNVLLPTSLQIHYRTSTRTLAAKQIVIQQRWWNEIKDPRAFERLQAQLRESIMYRFVGFELEVLKHQVQILNDSALSRQDALKLIQSQSLELKLKEAQVLALEASLYKAVGTRGWKLLEWYRNMVQRLNFLGQFKKNWFVKESVEINAWDDRIQSSSVTVIVPVFNGYETVVQTVFAFLSNTFDPTVSLLIVNDRSSDEKTTAFLSHLAEYSHRFNVFVITADHNGGFVESCNLGMERTTSDVVLLNSDTIVTKNWLDEILEVSSQKAVATVTPVSNNATILSLPRIDEENQMPTQLRYLNSFANKLAKQNLKRSQLIPTGHGFCLFIKRRALKKVGLFDLTFSPGYGEENDLCHRLSKAGWENRVATKSFVYHWGGSSFSQEKFRLQTEHQLILQRRYPGHELAVKQFQHQDPLRPLRSKAVKLLAETDTEQKKRLTVGIDGQILLSSGTTGTARYVRNIYQMMSRKELAKLQIDSFFITASTEFDQQISQTDHLHKFFAFQTVDLIRYGFQNEVEIYHKPQQIGTWEELYFFSLCSKRIITYLDLIAYRSPTYFDSINAHQEYQLLTRASLELADVILTISETVKKELVLELGIPADKIVVTHLGVEPRVFDQTVAVSEYKAWSKKFLVGEPYFLYVGTDFTHKNVMKVVQTFATLKESRVFSGQLVLVLKAATGGELPQLMAEIKARKLEKDVTIITDYVSDTELALFYKHATLHLNFSLAEGFGFTPLEAALAGVASVLSPTAIYKETMGDAAFFPLHDEVGEYVELIGNLLRQPTQIRKKAKQARLRARQFTWQASMDKVLKVYKQLRSKSPTSALNWSGETRRTVSKAKSITVKRHTLL